MYVGNSDTLIPGSYGWKKLRQMQQKGISCIVQRVDEKMAKYEWKTQITENVKNGLLNKY
jgi:hypothetical protein